MDNPNAGQPLPMVAHQGSFGLSSEYPHDYPAQSENQTESLSEPMTQAETEFWYADMQRSRPQIRSLGPAILIFMTAGMSFSWSVTFGPESPQAHAQVCWFIAVIFGAVVSAVVFRKLSKQSFYLLGSLLITFSGLLFVFFPWTTVISRYCNGIAYGLVLIPTIVVGAEQSAKRFRGYVLSVEQCGLIAGMTSHLYFWTNNSKVTFVLVAGVVGLLFTFLHPIESPIYHLRRGNQAEALNVIRLLRKPFTVTPETYSLLNENQQLLEEDMARGRSVNISIGLIPLVKLCLFRAIVTMSYSVPLIWGYTLFSPLTNTDVDLQRTYIFPVMRLVGVLFAEVVSLDSLGRKEMSAFSLLVGGGLLISVAVLFSQSQTDSKTLFRAKGLLMGYQVFAGLGAPASTCYLGEAFSISVKPYFILIAVVLENVVQIIICYTFRGSMGSVSEYAYALGILQAVFGIFVFFRMPETKQTMLREALAKFADVRTVRVRV